MNNEAIQILRTDNNGLTTSKQEELLLPGQPLYNSQKNYLTIGHIEGSQVTPLAKNKPITVRELIGYFDDNSGITATMNNKYHIKPSNNKLEIRNLSNSDNSGIDITTSRTLTLNSHNIEVSSDLLQISTRSNTPNITITSKDQSTPTVVISSSDHNQDIVALKIGDDTPSEGKTSNFKLKYIGTGSDKANYLKLTSQRYISTDSDEKKSDFDVIVVSNTNEADDAEVKVCGTTTTNNLVVVNGNVKDGIDLQLGEASLPGDRAIWMSSVFGTTVCDSHPAYSDTTYLKYNTENGGTLTTPKLVSQLGLEVTSGGIKVITGGVIVSSGDSNFEGKLTVKQAPTVSENSIDVVRGHELYCMNNTLSDVISNEVDELRGEIAEGYFPKDEIVVTENEDGTVNITIG